ncbi:MAG: hypothetical protein ACTHLE_09780 [Agriterribacter sp.]
MKTIITAILLMLFFSIGCKKNNDKQPDNPNEEKPIGPFSIYGEENCNGEIEGLSPNFTYGEAGKKIVYSTGFQPSDVWTPEFYAKKIVSGEYIVYSIEKHNEDTTFWVWYEPDEIENNCSFSDAGCGTVRLEAFKDLKAVSGSKYRYKFDPDNVTGTLIETPGGRFLYTGEGKERSTGNCNRFTHLFTAASAPCKALPEGEKIFDWCFRNKWFFRK